MVHEQVGYDGGKHIKGRKRHLWVDSLGMLLTAVLTAANVSEGAGLKQLLHQTPARQVQVERLDTVNSSTAGAGGASGYDVGGWGLPGRCFGAMGDGCLGLDSGESATPDAGKRVCVGAQALGSRA